MSQKLHEFDSLTVNNFDFVFLLQLDSWPSDAQLNMFAADKRLCGLLGRILPLFDIHTVLADLKLAECNFCQNLRCLIFYCFLDVIICLIKLEFFDVFLEVSILLSCHNFLENSKSLKADTILQPYTLR